MSKSKEELVEEVVSMCKELISVLYGNEWGYGRIWDKFESGVEDLIDQAHTVGKKARDEELLEVIEDKKVPNDGNTKGNRIHNQALDDIKNHLN